MNAEEAFQEGWSSGWTPDPLFKISEWADEHRMLSSKSASEPGRWRTSRAPYSREPMDELSAYSGTETVVLMWGAQTGKTECGNNFIGYVIHHAPGPMMAVQPTLDLAKRLSKQRIAPMIAETPALVKLVADSKSKDSSNTILSKEFLGGMLLMTGANSAVGLRSAPIRYLFLDEVDGYPDDVEGEGDPVALAIKRTTTFNRRKILITSTPTVAETSRVEREFERSDKRRYFIQCPHCQHEQWLRWRGYNDDPDDSRAKQYRLVWTGDDRSAAAYICESCGVHIEEKYKTQMLENGRWIPTALGDGKTKGYHLSTLYSPLGWKSWVEILKEFEEAATDPMKLKVFVNTVLAETWQEEFTQKLNAEGLAKRAEDYKMLTIPMRGLVVTAGIDVQDNRLEIVQRAWGIGEESWLINFTQIFGDPSQDDVWKQALDVVNMPLLHESGVYVKTYAVAIDSGGHHTHEVYTFTRTHKKRHIIAVKGQSVSGKPSLGKPTKQDINRRNQVIKNGANLWPVGSDTIKSLIYGRLKGTETGAGAYHWPLGLPEDYWKQLTAEKQATRMLNGFPKRVWVKKDGDRNEALDCEVYAYAALQYIYTRHNRVTFWQQMETRLMSNVPNLIETEDVTQAPPVASSDGRLSLSGWKR